MAYTKQTWVNDAAPPISAARLTYIEDGIEAAASTADTASGKATATETEVTTARGAEVDLETRLLSIDGAVSDVSAAKEDVGVAATAVQNHKDEVSPHHGHTRVAKHNGTSYVLTDGSSFTPTPGVTTIFKVYEGDPLPVSGTGVGQALAGEDIIIDGSGAVVA